MPWQGPSPLPQRYIGIRTSRWPKPPASARPAHGGRFSPAGSGAGLRCTRTCRSTGHRPARAGETRCVSCSRPEGRKHCHRFHGRGHRPCHGAALGSGPAGGQSPRPAPDPPLAGASHPPGRALASVSPGPAGLQDTVPRGRGKRAAFPVPARRGEWPDPDAMAGAIAPATALHWHQDQPGAKAPGQRPTRPSRALLARRVGRWPFVMPGPAGLQGTVPRGRGKRRAFPVPARRGVLRDARSLWQGPSPLPKRHAAPCQPGAKAPGQRPTRPRRALAFCCSRTCRSAGHRSARAGETRVAFPEPARRDGPFPRIAKSSPAGGRPDFFIQHPADAPAVRCRVLIPLSAP